MWALGQLVPRSLGLRTAALRHKRRRPMRSELHSQSENRPERRKEAFEISADREQKWQNIRLLKRKLTISVNEEDFIKAASIRDSIDLMTRSLSAVEQYSLRLIEALHKSSSVTERTNILSSLVEVGDVNVVPDVALYLRDPDLYRYAENCMLALFHKHSNPEIKNMMEEGMEALRKSSLSRALDIFESITQLDPSFAEGHNKKATTLYLMKQYQESIHVCLLVLELQPYHFLALAGMGLCYYHLQQNEQALKAFDQAVLINPGLSRIRSMAENLRKGNLPNL